MPHRPGTPARKTPTTARSFPSHARSIAARLAIVSAATLAASLLGSTARAEPLDEARVIELAASRDTRVLVAERAVDVAAARELDGTLHPNPTLSWQRSDLPGDDPLAESEDTIWLTVPLDVSGNRAARGSLARAGVASARAVRSRTRSDAVTDALMLFYGIVESEQRAATARVLLERLDEAARVIEKRREEGTASGYEEQRLALEREMAASRVRELEAQGHALEAELGALLRIDAPAKVRGELAVATPKPPAPKTAEPSAAERPSIQLQRRAVAETRQAQDDASLAWLPQISLMGGFRVRDSATTQYGYVAGVSLALPLFARGQDVERAAAAEQALAEQRIHAATTRAEVEQVRAAARFELAQAELARFEESTLRGVERLQRAAASGYREGQRTILELLDVQRSATAVEQRRLDLAAAARRAHVELRAARGELE